MGRSIQDGDSRRRTCCAVLAIIIGLTSSIVTQTVSAAQKKPQPTAPKSSADNLPPAESDSDSVGNSPPDESNPANVGSVTRKTILSDFEILLSGAILLFGVLVVGAEYQLLRKVPVTPDEALRVYSITLIVVGTLFSITAGFDSNQIAPAMGLFGTIAGYLLGRHAAGKSQDPEGKTNDTQP